MSKPPSPVRCVHCLVVVNDVTWDHVFPKSWYPDATPANVEKWKVPACHPCNKRYGQLEEQLLSRFALCLDPKSPEAQGLPQKVLRAADVRSGRNQKDARHRAGRLRKIHSELYKFAEVPKESVFPGFGPLPNLKYDEYIGVPLPQDDIRQLVLKLARGLALKLEGLYLSENLEVHCYPFESSGEPNINDVLRERGATYEWGKGITLCRAVEPDNPSASVTRIEFWGRLKLYVIVRPTNGGGIAFHGA